MVEFRKNDLVITVKNAEVGSVNDIRNALTTALVRLNCSEGMDFENESFIIGELLKSIAINPNVLETVCNESEFISNYNSLNTVQKRFLQVKTLKFKSKRLEKEYKQSFQLHEQ